LGTGGTGILGPRRGGKGLFAGDSYKASTIAGEGKKTRGVRNFLQGSIRGRAVNASGGREKGCEPIMEGGGGGGGRGGGRGGGGGGGGGGVKIKVKEGVKKVQSKLRFGGKESKFH